MIVRQGVHVSVEPIEQLRSRGLPAGVVLEDPARHLMGSVACDAVEAACWTCDAVPPPRSAPLGVVLCSDVPSIWPAPPPEPDAVPGCAGARFSGPRHAFDVSGALVGAEAFSQGPVTAPCNTRSVSAGDRASQRNERRLLLQRGAASVRRCRLVPGALKASASRAHAAHT